MLQNLLFLNLNSSKNCNTDSTINDEILSTNVSECKVAESNTEISSFCHTTSILKENSVTQDPAMWPDQNFFQYLLI